MGFFDLFRKREKDEVIGTKVLVCAVGDRFAQFVNEDAEIYGRHYPATTKATFAGVGELMKAIESGYDVIHLLCDVGPTGEIADSHGGTTTGEKLIDKCYQSNVKLLWIASDNPGEAYIKGFKARGKRLNLVMTLQRNGPKFTRSLDQLLSKMSGGDTMPVAWVRLWPQGGRGRAHADAPETFFVAGRGGVRLL
jgi:hypothetical protein